MNVGYLNDYSCIGPFYILGSHITASICAEIESVQRAKDREELERKKVVELQKKNVEEYLNLLVKTEEENFVI